MRRDPRTTSQASKAVRLVLAFAFLFAAFAQSVHSRELEHAVCSDHGELIHVGATGHGHGQPVTVAGRSDNKSGEQAHEHCVMVVASRETLAADGSFSLPTRSLPATRSFHRHRAPSAGVAAYLIAPKNSPPVV